MVCKQILIVIAILIIEEIYPSILVNNFNYFLPDEGVQERTY